jgi:hypothetical protein
LQLRLRRHWRPPFLRLLINLTTHAQRFSAASSAGPSQERCRNYNINVECRTDVAERHCPYLFLPWSTFAHTEEHFIRATYSAAQIVRPFPNGEDVDLNLIVDAIVDALEIMSSNISKVLILLDRERRSLSANELASTLFTALTQKCTNRTFYIGVADRQIENWIIADEQRMRECFDPGFSYSGDVVENPFYTD